MSAAQYLWHSDLASVSDATAFLRRNMLLLSGPSGAGKSAIALALSSADCSYMTMRNYTTRSARPTDHPGHFVYLSDREFMNEYAENGFFLARLQPTPRYAYKTLDLAQALSTEKRPILMFRHSGVRYMSEAVGQVPTVFIEGDPGSISQHSRNLISPPNEQEANDTLVANRKLYEEMSHRGWPVLRVTNHYSGEDELLHIAQQITRFLSEI